MKKIINVSTQLSLLLLLLFYSAGCKNKELSKNDLGNLTYLPVISTLFNNRMLILLKGTYATDSPLVFEDYSGGTGNFYIDTQGDGKDPAMDLTDLPKVKDVPIYIDFGEIRISSRKCTNCSIPSQLKNAAEIKKFWNYIAPDRQVYCTSLYAGGSSKCKEDSGLIKMYQFFNGDGAVYPSNDPPMGGVTSPSTAQEQTDFAQNPTIAGKSAYFYTGIFIRSFITAWARQDGGLITSTRFDTYPVSGLNIVPRLSFAPGTEAAAKDSILPLTFPILYQVQAAQQEDMLMRGGRDPMIFEVRTNIKENMMVHSYVTPAGSLQTLIGISDWFKDHNGESDIGGGLLARSRVIYPEIASNLQITGGTRSLQHYFSIFRKDETDFINYLPLAATPVRDGVNKIKYIHSGLYRLQCRADISPADGFPETLVRETFFSVPDTLTRNTIPLNLTCP